MPELVTRICDHHYDPLGGCDGVYDDETGVCDQCGRPPLKRRVRIPLDGGHMDVSLEFDAGPETIAALSELGEAAIAHIRRKENQLATRAKFSVQSITQFQGGTRQVKLMAVTGGGSDEDKSFWNATPAGSIEISISNPDAYELFEIGKPYYVDFSAA